MLNSSLKWAVREDIYEKKLYRLRNKSRYGARAAPIMYQNSLAHAQKIKVNRHSDSPKIQCKMIVWYCYCYYTLMSVRIVYDYICLFLFALPSNFLFSPITIMFRTAEINQCLKHGLLIQRLMESPEFDWPDQLVPAVKTGKCLV